MLNSTKNLITIECKQLFANLEIFSILIFSSAMAAVPSTFRRLMVNKISHKFKEACSIQSVQTPVLKDTELLVHNRFVGINASDVNFSAGRYARR